MACDLASEVYRPTRADDDVYVCDLGANVRVALGRRACKGRTYSTVAFCGTECWHDWLFNLMLWMVGQEDGIEGRVHAGFCRKWKSVQPKVIRVLKELDCRKIVVVGHSLGGALATISANDIARALPTKFVHAVTFGAPRCANAGFHSAPRPANLARFIRCVHVGDFVHYLPPFPGYEHPQDAEVVIVGSRGDDSRGTGVTCEECTHPLWEQLQRAWRGRLKIEYHQIFAYRRAITMGDIKPRSESERVPRRSGERTEHRRQDRKRSPGPCSTPAS